MNLASKYFLKFGVYLGAILAHLEINFGPPEMFTHPESQNSGHSKSVNIKKIIKKGCGPK